jgi:simple sugar transport system permease protein
MSRLRVFWNRTRVLSLLGMCLGAGLIWAGLALEPGVTSKLRFSRVFTWELPSALVFVLCGAGSLAAGVASFVSALRPWRLHAVCVAITALAVLLVVLVWAALDRRMDVVGLMAQSIRLATPIGLGALAGIMSERSGVVNIAIEGMMLTAACVGFTVALYAQSMGVGLVAAMLGGGVMAGLHAVLCIRFMVDQIISGTVINILAVGITGFIRRGFLLDNDLEAPAVFARIDLPVLSDIPILGKVLFSHQPLVYVMVLCTVGVWFIMRHTRWGLRTRTVGEHPRAADTLGINVFRVRYANVIASGMLAGLGGAWFSLETVGSFQELMTNGKGFIALAAMIFGKWNPFAAVAGALLFGFSDALQIKLQISGVDIPYQLLGMIPYVVTIVVLAGLVGRAIPPAADGIPYKRD